jgi:hypothetical protein
MISLIADNSFLDLGLDTLFDDISYNILDSFFDKLLTVLFEYSIDNGSYDVAQCLIRLSPDSQLFCSGLTTGLGAG